MDSLELYFSRLILRELEQFRDGPPKPDSDTATEVATSPASTRAQTPDTTTTSDSEDDKQQAAAETPQDIDALIIADEAANGFQGRPVKLIVLRSATDRQRKNNGARLQRIYRLAQKLGVSPGGPRWIRDGKPYMQPPVPRSVVREDGTIEYNQFMHDDAGKAVLRMPGGWKRDLVRSRPQFQGVAIIDGFLWPRFSPNLPRRMTVDWGKLTGFDVIWFCLVYWWKLTLSCWQRNKVSSSSTRFDTPLGSSRASLSLLRRRERTRKMVS